MWWLRSEHLCGKKIIAQSDVIIAPAAALISISLPDHIISLASNLPQVHFAIYLALIRPRNWETGKLAHENPPALRSITGNENIKSSSERTVLFPQPPGHKALFLHPRNRCSRQRRGAVPIQP